MSSDIPQKKKSEKDLEFQREAVPHMDALYNYALRMTGNSDDADDLLQDTYLKAYRFWDKYEKGTKIRAWLFRIMKNSYINLYRKVSKEPDTVDYEDVQNFYESIRDQSTSPTDLQDQIFGHMHPRPLLTFIGDQAEIRAGIGLSDADSILLVHEHPERFRQDSTGDQGDFQ